MSHINERGGASAVNFLCRVAAGAAFLALASIPAAAEVPDALADFFTISEVRAGVLKANLDDGQSEDAKALINGEILFRQLGADRVYNNAFLDVFLKPRPHIGASISTESGGTNQIYAGVTWEVRLTDWAFIEASFGGTLHDGPTDSNDPDSYGCSALFRESAGLGFDITEHTRLLFTIDHMSNASLCDQNQGLTNAGVKLGYRW